MTKVLIIVGTRPEAIKMAPLVKVFSKAPEVELKLCSTGQHKEILDQVFEFFELKVDYDLGLMKPGQDLFHLTSDILLSLKDVLLEFNPEYVCVHGDTVTCMASSMAAFYHGAKICHVEAGLRTYNKLSPYPEEVNRQITARFADIHFAPTEKAKENLIAERIEEEKIVVTGNTVIDALYDCLELLKDKYIPEIIKLQELVDNGKKTILVTGHRRENHGAGLDTICSGLTRIASLPNVQIIYPIHPNPRVQEPVNRLLGNVDEIALIKPLSYPAFVWLMSQSKIIITDSGGIQEEAPSLGKPVLLMRNNTERPEAVEQGSVILVGTDEDSIYTETKALLENEDKYERMSQPINPYGDSKASERILKHLLKHINES